MWARSRFSAVINGFEPGQGYVNWPPKLPMAFVLDAAEMVGIKPEHPNLVSWRHAEAVVLQAASGSTTKGSFYKYRFPPTVPMRQAASLDDGLGTKNDSDAIKKEIEEQYNGRKLDKKDAQAILAKQGVEFDDPDDHEWNPES